MVSDLTVNQNGTHNSKISGQKFQKAQVSGVNAELPRCIEPRERGSHRKPNRMLTRTSRFF